jgi:N-formylglutamate amidohydrolase
MNWIAGKSYEYMAGDTAVVLSIPHCSSAIPQPYAESMTVEALKSSDTDWYVDQLYDFAVSFNVPIIKAKYSRYIIDLNREPSGKSLYPGQFTTALCPTESFSGQALYKHGLEPGPEEISSRKKGLWQPYHDQLQALIDAAHERHGYAIVFDAHSIASRVPLLFDGQLPDLNVGTNNAQSCAPSLIDTVRAVPTHGYSRVVDGRFKGGYICRHYGNPQHNVHSLQLELSQATYLNEASGEWHPGKAEELQVYLKSLLQSLFSWRP